VYVVIVYIIKSLEKNYITRTSFGLFSYAVSDVDGGNRMSDELEWNCKGATMASWR
jgi:hypothetical protein